MPPDDLAAAAAAACWLLVWLLAFCLSFAQSAVPAAAVTSEGERSSLSLLWPTGAVAGIIRTAATQAASQLGRRRSISRSASSLFHEGDIVGEGGDADRARASE